MRKEANTVCKLNCHEIPDLGGTWPCYLHYPWATFLSLYLTSKPTSKIKIAQYIQNCVYKFATQVK